MRLRRDGVALARRLAGLHGRYRTRNNPTLPRSFRRRVCASWVLHHGSTLVQHRRLRRAPAARCRGRERWPQQRDGHPAPRVLPAICIWTMARPWFAPIGTERSRAGFDGNHHDAPWFHGSRTTVAARRPRGRSRRSRVNVACRRRFAWIRFALILTCSSPRSRADGDNSRHGRHRKRRADLDVSVRVRFRRLSRDRRRGGSFQDVSPGSRVVRVGGQFPVGRRQVDVAAGSTTDVTIIADEDCRTYSETVAVVASSPGPAAGRCAR